MTNLLPLHGEQLATVYGQIKSALPYLQSYRMSAPRISAEQTTVYEGLCHIEGLVQGALGQMEATLETKENE